MQSVSGNVSTNSTGWLSSLRVTLEEKISIWKLLMMSLWVEMAIVC